MVEITVSHRILRCGARLASGERAELRITGAGAESAAGLALWLCDDGRAPVAAAPSLAPAQGGALSGLLDLATREMDALVAGVPAGRALSLWAVLGDLATGEVLAAGRVAVCASWMPDDLADLGGLADPLARMGDLAPAFDETGSYEAGDVVCEGGALWVFTAAHSGPWDAADAERTTLAEQLGQGGGEYLPLAGGTVTGDVVRASAVPRWSLDFGDYGPYMVAGGYTTLAGLAAVVDGLPADKPGGIRARVSADWSVSDGPSGTLDADVLLVRVAGGDYVGSASPREGVEWEVRLADAGGGLAGIQIDGARAATAEPEEAEPAPARLQTAADGAEALAAMAQAVDALSGGMSTVAQIRSCLGRLSSALARFAALAGRAAPALAALLLAGGAAAVPLEDVDLSLDVDTNSMAETAPYATRPWRIGAEYVPLQAARAVTNGDTWAWAYGGADGIGARVSLEVDDRPTAWAYPPPAGEWSVSGGTMDEATLVVSPTADVVRVAFAADDGAAQSIALNVRSASPGAAGEPVAPVAGTWRAACTDALLSRLAAGTNSAPAAYPWCRPAVFSSTFCTWTNRAAFQRFGDGSGDWYGLPASANAGFFWPALATNLMPYSVAKGDKPGTWGDSQVLVVAPHYAIGAAHAGHFGGAVATNLAPLAVMRNSVEHGVAASGRTYYYGIPTSISPSKVGDAQVVRFRDAFPSNCIARLADAAALAALSPSFPARWPALQGSQHQTLTPVAIAGATTNAAGVVSVSMRGAWAAEGFDGLYAFRHDVHIYDSSCLVCTAGPRGQLIPLFLFYTAGGGPALFGANVEAIDEIIRADSDGAESVWRWTPEELQ